MLVISSTWWDEVDKTQRIAGVALLDFLRHQGWLPLSPVNVWLCVSGSLSAWDSPSVQLAWGRARDGSV